LFWHNGAEREELIDVAKPGQGGLKAGKNFGFGQKLLDGVQSRLDNL
jgi:hypothetical protein